jgi:STE24 endopeptidase
MARRAILLFVAAVLTLVTAAATAAADAPGPPATPAYFDAEAATAAYMASLPAEARARSDAYFEGGYWLSLWDAVVAVAVAWLLLGSGLSARIRDRAERLTRFKWLQTTIYAVAYIVVISLITLPWAAYEGYFREHQYGMSNQDLGAWLGDQGKGLVIGLIFGSLAAVAIYAVIRRAAKTWWLWGAIVALLLLVFQVAIAPTYLEPVFNKFYPLTESPLKRQILSLARANGIPATQVYEFDASKRTTKMSAHVSGLFGTAQISLNDNLMNRGSPEEVKAVLGHEMGHYVLNHVNKTLVFLGVIIVVGFAFLSWSFGRVQARFGRRWGIRDVTDVAGMPLLVALFGLYLFALTPVLNTMTRTMEAEADAFGINAARQPDGFAQAALHLSEYRKMQPGPIEEYVFFDHPSGWNRIHRSMIWKSENIGAPDIAAYDAAHPAAPVSR